MLKAEGFYSAAQLAAMKLPGLPTTKRKVNELADAQGWRMPSLEGTAWRKRAKSGGGFEYHFSLLPARAQKALLRPDVARRERQAKRVDSLRLVEDLAASMRLSLRLLMDLKQQLKAAQAPARRASRAKTRPAKQDSQA